jgi:hypothetical protein
LPEKKEKPARLEGYLITHMIVLSFLAGPMFKSKSHERSFLAF